MQSTPDYLREYLKLGLSIIPIKPDTKLAAVNWKPYQFQRPTFEQIKIWHDTIPNASWAVVTGKISGITVVDTDNPAALNAAVELGLTNSCCVQTNHGHHFYFKYLDDDKDRKNVSGGSLKESTYWPAVDGLDLRNNGGYALLPPSPGYEWQIDELCIEEEMTMYQDWPGAVFEDSEPAQPLPVPPSTNKFEDLDLTNTTAEGAGKTKNGIREKFKELAEQFSTGKIPRGGSGIHDATYRFLAEEVLFVGMGPELEEAGRKFMDDFFASPLKDGRFETSLNTVRDKERTNHPERFSETGVYQYHLKEKGIPELNSIPITNQGKLIQRLTSNEAMLFAEEKPEFWQVPWCPKNSIIQVYGYSGHGKSLFLQHALHSLGTGSHCGPFDHGGQTAKILYLDFENGTSTLSRRVSTMLNSFGNPKENLIYWTPWLADDQINLRDKNDENKLFTLLNQERPDIVVIDTLRSAYPGLKENSAEDWSDINQLALKIRNAGCTVIMVHHSNKPDKDGLGREAGSSNQLTTLETQLRVTQVFEDADLAKLRGGIHADDLPENPYAYMRKQVKSSATLQIVFELSYGKVREWTDLHEPKQYMGLALLANGRTRICYSQPIMKRFATLVRTGKYSKEQIIGKLQRPSSTLEKWAEELKVTLPK